MCETQQIGHFLGFGVEIFGVEFYLFEDHHPIPLVFLAK